jgi:hypothetical protein
MPPEKIFRLINLTPAACIASLWAATTPALAVESSVAHQLQATTQAEQQAVLAYWTPERMAHTVPMDLPLLEGKNDAGTPAVPNVAGRHIVQPVPVTNKPPSPTSLDHTRAFPEMGAPWPGGGNVAATSGRLFFDIPGTGPSSCSANAVASTNRSTVMTAGHCLTLNGQWFEKVIFVPGYRSGHAPYGVWTAKQTATTPQWAEGNDMQHDVGTLIVNPLEGQQLTDVVGGSGLEFNRDISNPEHYGRAYAFGYPINFDDGQTLTYCSADAVLAGGTQPGMFCGMTGGASGGPWLMDFSEQTGLGIQNSVNHKGGIGVLLGSYFGTSAQVLYEATQTAH